MPALDGVVGKGKVGLSEDKVGADEIVRSSHR